jgi:N-formylglutamate amidohydrolase
MKDPVTIIRPRGAAVPVVFDSPHSGAHYPDDFDYKVPLSMLRRGEDPYVDALFAAAPDHGAPLIVANFSRMYIDPNRSAADIDPDMLDGDWPHPLTVSQKSRSGMGLIRTRSGRQRAAIYDRKLSVAEVRGRIENYWRPYHDMLRQALDETHDEFGAAWHVNCHSMPSKWATGFEKAGEPNENDYVLGNRDGATAGAEFTELVRATLAGFGFKVAVNDGQKGVELVRAHGDPKRNRHSLQIEINRRLYWDERNFAKRDCFDEQRQTITKLIAVICDYARGEIS